MVMVVLVTCSTAVGTLVAERNTVHPVEGTSGGLSSCCCDVSCVSILIDLFDCVNYSEL